MLFSPSTTSPPDAMDQLQSLRMQFLQELNSNFENNTNAGHGGNQVDNESAVTPTLPPNMRFTSRSLIIIIIYSLCFVVALVGNLTVFVTLSRGRYRKSRISLMMCHLSIADLFVTFFTIPLEIGWRITVQWIAGNTACKVLQFFRAFGLYLSNNILICVSLDRYFAVLHPLRVNDARRRGKFMLSIAWILSTVYSVPQAIVFHVRRHPEVKNFTQCVTFESFPSDAVENLYNMCSMACMYFIPLATICWVYSKILGEISSKSRDNNPVATKSSSSGTRDDSSSTHGSKMRLRRSDMSSIERARSRTLRMTIKIVIAFIFCWTPYITMSLWYMIDRKSAERVNEMVQESLFIMAVSNSCANPLVYGCYTIDLKKECCRCFLPCVTRRKPNHDVNLIPRSLDSKFQKPETKYPGVSKIIRQAVRGFFKVGSGQTKSTNICANKLLVSASSPRLSAASVVLASKNTVTIEKLPLRTIKPRTSVKLSAPKSPCSEPARGHVHQNNLVDLITDFPIARECQSA